MTCTVGLKRALYNMESHTSTVERLRARGNAGESVETHGSKQGAMLMLWTARRMCDDAELLFSKVSVRLAKSTARVPSLSYIPGHASEADARSTILVYCSIRYYDVASQRSVLAGILGCADEQEARGRAS
jgi:hypothetical protein